MERRILKGYSPIEKEKREIARIADTHIAGYSTVEHIQHDIDFLEETFNKFKRIHDDELEGGHHNLSLRAEMEGVQVLLNALFRDLREVDPTRRSIQQIAREQGRV